MNNGESNFTINEINNFRTLVHIFINLNVATDEILKIYLAHKLSQEIQKNEDLRINNQRFQ